MVSLEDAKKIVDRALNLKEMLILIGDCSVRYQGRAGSKLGAGQRVLIAKGDGAFMIHQKHKVLPVNYQPPGTLVTGEMADGELVIRAHRKKPAEEIETRFSNILFAESFDLKDDKKLRTAGTERDLAELLMQDLHAIEPGLKPMQHEASVLQGYIDIVAKDPQGNTVLVELKRKKAGLGEVTQLLRYVREVAKRKDRNVRGILCAPSITPNAKTFLLKEGLEFRKLDYEMLSAQEAHIKGLEKKQKGLGEFI